eukprot:TRINITY_DN9352_c0_g1_i1.p2 TRINITY_DN9352_c0_g1~~TRINITY_DN9352_c0_g1_i1.p2  ORF type:complete len:105 (-),score=15.45 TRINITY_DN9352_c0_g1_i1:30-344(-)
MGELMCELCCVSIRSMKQYEDHVNGKRHARRLMRKRFYRNMFFKQNVLNHKWEFVRLLYLGRVCEESVLSWLPVEMVEYISRFVLSSIPTPDKYFAFYLEEDEN